MLATGIFSNFVESGEPSLVGERLFFASHPDPFPYVFISTAG